jgi:hypothetical protein
MNDFPQDIRLWLLTAHNETGMLEQEVPLPVSHDTLKRGLVRDDAGAWVLTASGWAALIGLMND